MCGIIGAIQKSPVLVITDEGNTGAFSSLPSSVRILETCGLGLDHALLGPILEVVPLQLLAFLVSGALGNDVDQPRNLAKTVTV